MWEWQGDGSTGLGWYKVNAPERELQGSLWGSVSCVDLPSFNPPEQTQILVPRGLREHLTPLFTDE